MITTPNAITARGQLLNFYKNLPNGVGTEQRQQAKKQVLDIIAQLGPLHDPGLVESISTYLRLIGRRIGEPSLADRLQHLSDDSAADAKSPDHPVNGHVVSAQPLMATASPPQKLPRISATGQPGISLVTCCMNRNENLCKALQSWLPHAEINEIVIVDWSSAQPVQQELAARGITDPRIRIVRVDGEPRWILSYAFNAGFRAAAYEQILKVDADIVLSADFFTKNPLQPNSFIAGNWRKAEKNQVFVNGFFYAPRTAIHAVGGFNEFITTYGWDDDDIYQRMTTAGFGRQDVGDNTVTHLDHTDDERLGETAHLIASQSAEDSILAETGYKIRRNRYLANVMPDWSQKSHPVGFSVIQSTPALLQLQREQWVPSEVPPHINKQADYIALWEIASWRLGPRVRQLEEPALRGLLAKPLDQITKLDIELAIANPARDINPDAVHLVVRVQRIAEILSVPAQRTALVNDLQELIAKLAALKLNLVIQAPLKAWPFSAPQELKSFELVPSWENIGELKAISWKEVAQAAADLRGPLQTDWAPELRNAGSSPAPMIQVPRAKLFIDVQHGLGNRLRAMGSAAAIAEATDRELVVVWQPDPHCEGRIFDLYEYKGAVEEEAFLATAQQKGCKVYNYMEAEAGSQKDAPIDLSHRGDIYARAAYVLKAEPSTWEFESQFLRSLKPVPTVRDMVNSVRTPNDVSAHVRMVGGAEYEHLAYESMANWTAEGHAQIDFWRKKSHFSHFIKRIDQLIKEGRADRIFLAADKPETYEAFVQTFGERVAYLERELYDRSAEQLRYALADALLLGTSPLLLGSTWSSFSELAMRLSANKPVMEMSGKDF